MLSKIKPRHWLLAFVLYLVYTVIIIGFTLVDEPNRHLWFKTFAIYAILLSPVLAVVYALDAINDRDSK